MISFSRATGADAHGIETLYKQLVPGLDIKVTPQRIDELLISESAFLLVAKTASEVIGTALIIKCEDVMFENQPFAVIENVVVTLEKRGHGVGKDLMREIEDKCRYWNCSKIMIMSSSHRSAAHSFFKRCGYDSDAKKGFVKYGRQLKSAVNFLS